MSDLPDRRDYDQFDNDTELIVLRAWRDGDLKSREEMDEEAAIRELMRWHGEDVTWQFWWQAIRDAAWGVADE